MNKKKICVVTGARSEYGILRTIIKKILESKSLELSLFVTGIHLLKKYGYSIEMIEEDKFPIEKVISMYNDEEYDERFLGKSVGRAVINFTEAFYKIKPDFLLVVGDRYEVLAAVIAASTLSIPIGHIHGGDHILKGQVDEQIRHAITKFSHIHFPATQKSCARIKLLGEEDWRIHMVGSPSIDMIVREKLFEKDEICKMFELNPSKKIILCVQHPYLFESEKAGEQMEITLKVLKDLKMQTVITYPNNDPGSEFIIKEIESNQNIQYFKIFKNIRRIEYLSLLKHADLLIGNSSSGLIETPIFKLPVVNIGDRNRGRESAENVINVSHNYHEIEMAIKKGLSSEFRKICENVKNPYGDGCASERIVKILEKIEINSELLIKKLIYTV